MCGFCQLEEFPTLKARGLCLESLFDTKYSWIPTLINERHSFRGTTGTLLFWNMEQHNWTIELYSNKSIYAVLNNTDEYPLGTHTWTVYNEPCYENNMTQILINIHACNKSEFNCNDGMCIPMEQRCNGDIDCPDKSDEVDCDIIQVDESYIQESPPRSKSGEELLKVLFTVDILSILEIKAVDHAINIQFVLNMTWLDKRLDLKNLKVDSDFNTLNQVQKDRLWIPQVVFRNTNKKETSKRDQKSVATVLRRGNFSLNLRNQLHLAHLYSGADNPISIARVYDPWFQCRFDMTIYPFDTQICRIVLQMTGNSGRFVDITPETLRYLGPTDLTQYFVKKIQMEVTTANERRSQHLKIDIVFGRRILGAMLTTFLPTILLCVVSFATNYFKAEHFEANVTVNLTSLLTLTTLFISVSNSLPKTSYLKMIEVWLIVTLLIPFTEVVVHTVIDSTSESIEEQMTLEKPLGSQSNASSPRIQNFVHKENKELKSLLRKRKMALIFVKIGLPTLFCVFVVGYFIYGISHMI